MTLLRWSSGRKSVRATDVDPGQVSYQRIVERMFRLLGTCQRHTQAGAIGDAIDHSGNGKGCLPGYGVQTMRPYFLGNDEPGWGDQGEDVLSTFRLFHLARGETGITVTLGAGSISYLTRMQVRRLSDFAVVDESALDTTDGGTVDSWLSYRFEDLKAASDPGETFLFCTLHPNANTDFYRSVSLAHDRRTASESANTGGDLVRNRGAQTRVPFNNNPGGAKTAKFSGMHAEAVTTGTPLTAWHVATAAADIAALDERISGAPSIGNVTHTLFATGGTTNGNADPDDDPYQSGAQKTEANEPVSDLQNSCIGWGAVTLDNADLLDNGNTAVPPGIDSQITATVFDGKPVYFPDLATNGGQTEFVFLISSSFDALFDDELDVKIEVRVRNQAGVTISTSSVGTWTQCGGTPFGFARANVPTARDERCEVRVQIICTRFASHPDPGVFSLLSVLQHQPQD